MVAGLTAENFRERPRADPADDFRGCPPCSTRRSSASSRSRRRRLARRGTARLLSGYPPKLGSESVRASS